VVSIDEAYIHCSKHIPMLQHASEDAESGRRAGDVFKAKHGDRAWLLPAAVCEPEPEPVIGEVRFAPTPPIRRHTPQPVRK
jgi:hypothetical protein